MEVLVFWVIDLDGDRVVGTTHSPEAATELLDACEAETHHPCRIVPIGMTVPPSAHPEVA